MNAMRVNRIVEKVKDRNTRLSTTTPSLRKNYNITVESAQKLISPLSHTKVVQSDLNFVMHVLESVNDLSESSANTLANFIGQNIINGVTEDCNLDFDKYNITESQKQILEKAVYETAICQRIINNQQKLMKRFNVNKIVQENMYNTEKVVTELCELIDTYNVPDNYKYSVALENILYTMCSNGMDVDSGMVIDKITEYFLFRDMYITDKTYDEYKQVLSENCFYNESESTLFISEMMNNKPDYFKNSVLKALSSSIDPYILEFLLPQAMNIITEADTMQYIDEASSYINGIKVDDNDIDRICYSVSCIPNYTNINRDFIKMKSKDVLPKTDFNDLSACDCIVSDIQSINEKDKPELFDKHSFLDLFSEENDYASDSLNKLIAKFKADQDKSPSKIKNFFIKLHTKSPESIIDETYSIMSLARAGILLAVAASSPIGPIISGVLGLISWLLSYKINDKQATKLLDSVRKEKKKINEKIDNTSNEKKKEQYEEYLKCLSDSEEKIVKYLDTISNDDHSDDEDMDDLDFDLESSVINVSKLLSIAESVVSDKLDINMKNIVDTAIQCNELSSVSEIVKSSSYPIDEYVIALTETVNDCDDIKIRTAATIEKDKILGERYTSPIGVKSILAAQIANEELKKLNYEVVQEKFSLNTVKLALQNAKARIRDLDTKQKSISQSLDAAGSGLIKSIEKAMTSDRREAIIKGSIIPSFSKCIKGAIALAATGVAFGPAGAIIAAVGALATSSALNAKERKLIYDEIDTELKVVEKQIEIAQNDNDMNQYRFLLNYQKKLTREYQRIKYGLKVQGRDIPSAYIPGKAGK